MKTSAHSPRLCTSSTNGCASTGGASTPAARARRGSSRVAAVTSRVPCAEAAIAGLSTRGAPWRASAASIASRVGRSSTVVGTVGTPAAASASR